MSQKLRLHRVKAGHYTAYGGRYTVLQEPDYAVEWDQIRCWLVYDEIYSPGGGIVMERMARLSEVRENLPTYHEEVLELEEKRDNTANSDVVRVKALLSLQQGQSVRNISKALKIPEGRVRTALKESNATSGIWGPRAADLPNSRI